MSIRWTDALSWLLPLRCLACPRLSCGSPWRPFLCADCASNIASLAGPTRIGEVHLVAAFHYAGPVRVLIRELKFRGSTALARPLGTALGARLVDLPPGRVGIVPVPLHWRRLWRRGHNQSAALARAVARTRPGFQVLRALRKAVATAPQVGLDGGRRRRNVQGSLAIRRRAIAQVAGARLVLVDDVATTGATLVAGARCLYAAGAASVTLAAVAVADRPSGVATGELRDRPLA